MTLTSTKRSRNQRHDEDPTCARVSLLEWKQVRIAPAPRTDGNMGHNDRLVPWNASAAGNPEASQRGRLLAHDPGPRTTFASTGK
jgi:hypothetical protein